MEVTGHVRVLELCTCSQNCFVYPLTHLLTALFSPILCNASLFVFPLHSSFLFSLCFFRFSFFFVSVFLSFLFIHNFSLPLYFLSVFCLFCHLHSSFLFSLCLFRFSFFFVSVFSFFFCLFTISLCLCIFFLYSVCSAT